MRQLIGLVLGLVVAGCGESLLQPALDLDLEARFGHTAGPTTPSIVESFDDATLDELEDPDNAYTVAGGVIRKTTFTSNEDRSYVRTLATGYNGADFTAELTFTLTDLPGAAFAIHFFGLGPGVPDGPFKEGTGIFFRIHGSDIVGGRVDLAARAPGSGFTVLDSFGNITTSGGTHRARITKTGNRIDVAIDTDYDGTFAADMSTSILDMSAVAGFLDSSNSRIYFGTASDVDVFDDLEIRTVSADPTSKDQCKNGGWEEFGFRNQGQCIRFVNTGKDSREGTG